MTRSGPNSTWLDRLWETERPEYLDRDDVSPEVHQKIIHGLDRLMRVSGLYESFVRWTLRPVAGIARPRILELGAGHGALSRALLDKAPNALVTASDVYQASVDDMLAGPLGTHPRAEVKLIDATAIDEPDGTYDLAVFCQSLHHLPPSMIGDVLREGTRVARKLVIIDGYRMPWWAVPAMLAFFVPTALAMNGFHFTHDGVVSLRKMYSADSLQQIAAGAGLRLHTRFEPPFHLVATATR
ncbi:class I SAM-dependent methyltransferase [Pseudonocardiaceae bacterium YIM PH 21723]|nr:class I SAM-dependent methyltransferase [Pseudonocardiaceae bacterium YIM PH 21723]